MSGGFFNRLFGHKKAEQQQENKVNKENIFYDEKGEPWYDITEDLKETAPKQEKGNWLTNLITKVKAFFGLNKKQETEELAAGVEKPKSRGRKVLDAIFVLPSFDFKHRSQETEKKVGLDQSKERVR